MNRSTDEIRILEARVYSREGHATPADVKRLATLQGLGRDVPSGADARLRIPASAIKSEEGHTSGAGRPRGRVLRSRSMVAGALVFTLAIGIAGGIGIAALIPPEPIEDDVPSEPIEDVPSEPIEGVIPPDPGMYRSDSVKYYGDFDGDRIWSGELLDDEGRQCLIVQTAGSEGVSCVGYPEPSRVATVMLPEEVDGKPRTISIDFSDASAPLTISPESG
ncbi:hypothetical protein [Microbacterium sp. W4I20]|uniref:hypothetical protein n=1 Tax=Microbacterium sp. W4I20 TaxID=3042262 RepID=UPI002784243D|nr:hypothetical protein [Microbacterium sp. W4I20]MDQ0729090.1 hypothetical protein [Microbacterium sp. W4I20]